MFARSLRLVDECDLTFLHVFPYSPRPARRPRGCRRSRVQGAVQTMTIAGHDGERLLA
jgi:tRNA A37 methylthiotransferase MiaB